MTHPSAICESASIGEGTAIRAFARILPGAVIGSECVVGESVFVENDVRIGSRVTIWNGVHLCDGTILEDDVFVGPNATFTNDRFPRSGRPQAAQAPLTIVRQGASIGANATILPGIEIGTHAMVGAGAVVTRNVPPYATVYGNPARIQGYVDSAGDPAISPSISRRSRGDEAEESAVSGIRILHLPEFADLRGNLTVAEYGAQLPFVPQRVFIIQDVSSTRIRGEHAHRQCAQVLICTRGTVTLMVDDGRQREEFVLSSPTRAIYVPPMIWAAQYRYSEDASVVVLASMPYDPDDYIRDYSAWKKEIL